MKKNIKVSVIVPVYNVEKYLNQCLDSLVNQTLEDIEIIVVNDGSPDNSQSIIDDYVKRYPKKVFSYIKKNGGLSSARNFGVEKAKGEYLAFVDSDDYVSTQMMESLYQKASLEKSDMVVCKFYTFDDITVKNSSKLKNLDLFNHSVKENPQILLESQSYSVNKLYRRSWFIKNHFQFPVGQYFEDSACVYNFMFLANKISAVDEFLYYYRVNRNDSITNLVGPSSFDIFKSCKSILDFYRSHTDDLEILAIAERLCQIHIFTRLRTIIKSHNQKLAFSFYHRTLIFFHENMPDWSDNKYYQTAKKSKSLNVRIRHIPILMYSYLLIPNFIKTFLRKFLRFILRKKKSRKSQGTYINQNRLRELQLLELDILKEADRICKEHHLTYYLGEGTLLGAVRHHGFIPWDDDLDIVMPRADYQKFLEIAKKELNESYYLINETVLDQYYLPFSKIVLLDKHGFSNMAEKFDEKYTGPFIDIFPLDYYDSLTKGVDKTYCRIRKIRDMLLLKVDAIKPRRWKRKLYNFQSKFLSFKTLHKKLNKQLLRFNSNAPYMANFGSSYHLSKQLVEKKVYGKPKYIKFEDSLFPVPHDYDTLLKTIYGDYMQMPPVRKQVSKHSFYDEESVYSIAITKPIEDAQIEINALAEVRRLQLYSLKVLKELKRVCEKNNLTYYLGEGTLLGAIRHQGFIPWDDDVDVIMPRESFDRFLALASEELASNYQLQYYHNIKNYWVQSPKVRMLDKTEFNQTNLLQFTENVGPYIDIFPLDYTDPSLKKLEKQGNFIKRYRRMLFLKTGFSRVKNFKQRLLKIYSHFLSVQTIHKRINKMATKYNGGSQEFITNFGSYYDVRYETFNASAFDETLMVPFEDELFPVPKDYDYILRTIYGDYLKLPPVSKQKAKHSFNK